MCYGCLSQSKHSETCHRDIITSLHLMGWGLRIWPGWAAGCFCSTGCQLMGLIACIGGDLKSEGNSAVAVVNVTDPGVRLKGLKPWFYYFFPLWPWQYTPPAPCFSSFKKKMITVSTSVNCYESCYVSPKMCWDIMVAFIVAVNILMIWGLTWCVAS